MASLLQPEDPSLYVADIETYVELGT